MAKHPAASTVPETRNHERSPPRWRLSELATGSFGWLTSLIVHMLLLIVLGLWGLPHQRLGSTTSLDVTTEPLEPEPIEHIVDERIVAPADPQAESFATLFDAQSVVTETVDVPAVNDLTAPPTDVDFMDMGNDPASQHELLAEVGASVGDALQGRRAGQRAALVARLGGSEGSEQAVTRALNWLAAHQNPDGSWNLDHRLGACRGRCSNQGQRAPAHHAATALALLPFLGAGHTPKSGTQKSVVEAGIQFLLRSMKVEPHGGSWFETGGTMYSHGLASIAVCECYAMTKDSSLIQPAQLALDFIAYAQDPVGGGWRYQPQTPGDTSVVGWQLMALKSGHMALLQVGPATIRGASVFLDSVQQEQGVFYGYTTAGQQRRMGTTAIGLLCRMYLGWRRDHPALVSGVQWISQQGPSLTDFYANYYATQVMFQFTGGQDAMWKKWNTALRDQLVETQETEGHARGSWFEEGAHGNAEGGRLYCTALATMMLEVYYRHMPIYGQQATEQEFPL